MKGDKSAVTRNRSRRQILNYVMKIVLFFDTGVRLYIITGIFLFVCVLIFGDDLFIYLFVLFFIIFFLLLLLFPLRLNSKLLSFGLDSVSTAFR